MSASPGPAMSASSLFGDPAAIRCERAVAELRAGRPVLLHDGQGQRLAVIALDSATASSFAAFATAARERHYLFPVSYTPLRAHDTGRILVCHLPL
ncbi:hypothetical protein ACQ5SF_15975, partial [Stenotrophomonas muris]